MNEGSSIRERVGLLDRKTGQELLPSVYEDLRKLAARRMARLAPGQTLQATALVHEAWLRLGNPTEPNWENRAHLFAAAAEAMRQVLVDTIRRKSRLKRGGGQHRMNLEDMELAADNPDENVLRIHEAIELLRVVDSQKARVVVLKFFGGLTDREAALSLGVTERTIERQWAYAKAWLMRAMAPQP
jgi:RNA polymerase sigma factor (TIGR02999 family)